MLNKWLPFIGQCSCRFVVGLGAGALVRNAYKHKCWVAGTSFTIYMGVRYLVQQNFFNQKVE